MPAPVASVLRAAQRALPALSLRPAVLDALGTPVAAMPIEQLFAHREEMVGLQRLRGCQPCCTERMHIPPMCAPMHRRNAPAELQLLRLLLQHAG